MAPTGLQLEVDMDETKPMFQKFSILTEPMFFVSLGTIIPVIHCKLYPRYWIPKYFVGMRICGITTETIFTFPWAILGFSYFSSARLIVSNRELEGHSGAALINTATSLVCINQRHISTAYLIVAGICSFITGVYNRPRINKLTDYAPLVYYSDFKDIWNYYFNIETLDNSRF